MKIFRGWIFCTLPAFFAASAIADDVNYACQAKWYHAPPNAESAAKPEIRKCSERNKLETAGSLTNWSGYITERGKVYFVTRQLRRESLCPGIGPGAMGNLITPRCWSKTRHNDVEERVYQFVGDDANALLKPVQVMDRHGSHQPIPAEQSEQRDQFAVIGEAVFHKGIKIPNADAKSFELVFDKPGVMRELLIAQDKNNTYIFRRIDSLQILPRLPIDTLNWVNYRCATPHGCPNGITPGMFRIGNDGYWMGWRSSGLTVFHDFATADLECYFEGTGNSGDRNYCVRQNMLVVISQVGAAEHPVLVNLQPLIDRKNYLCSSARELDPIVSQRIESIIRKTHHLLRSNKDRSILPPDAERLLRIAAAYGNSYARKKIMEFINKGPEHSEATHFLNKLAEIGVPGANHDLAEQLKKSPLEIDQNKAILAYKTAADQGDTKSMLSIARILDSVHYDPEFISQIRECAASNGDADAAYLFAKSLEAEQKYPTALKAYQNAVKAGSADAALRLASIFGYGKAPGIDVEFKQASDPDRAERYYAVSRGLILGYSEEAHRIEEFVPLPPAKLGYWNGKLQAPDQAPQSSDIAEEILVDMAKRKGLDPATGHPL